ncbi:MULTISPECIES: glycosyltransferase [unclassified Rubrivivax]|uniref:glycosyltransferase n=1 Tax=unclassified Rubrivivax TaxID=2649762 RepID=UPI001E5D269D|nr:MULTISPECIES: glycosyltransferase [unclassified Rubrivivax]MCC9595491.1 glycosyltransferase [Rubrivivax sp. JA1055]MCC9647002.1 glycosyltransferase [Rubrivivax sp. JA1029]
MEDLTASNSTGPFASRSQRWIFDLQACQTAGSAHRGVGRYSQSLFEAILARREAVDLWGVLGSGLPHRPALRGLGGHRVVELPAWPDAFGRRKHHGGPRDELEGLLLAHRLAPLKADLLHVSHVFEGFGDGVALPSHAAKAPGQVVSATLYDLIPLLFQDHYFQSDEFARWYHARLDWLRQADLLLAISESSRQDAIDLLGIEPRRIVTIHGGIGPQFVPAADPAATRAAIRSKYGLRERFVLYTGGDDHRKNIGGAIRGYAELPAPLRLHTQLVIVCSMDPSRREMYLDEARRAGLAQGDVLITGFVPEADLVGFYQSCDVFLFPSLYEGLGLPVLEAMACGAPTIGGDNSSIRELIGRADAMFDAASGRSIAGAITKVLTDEGYAAELREHGHRRAPLFTWQRSAGLAVEAMAEAVQRHTQQGTSAAVSGWVPRKRLAVLTPLPPCRSGIADYNAKFLPFLARHFDIDLVVDGYAVSDSALTATFPVLQASEFERVAHLYDAILYEFGNSEFHRYMLPLLERFPGVVGLHDAFLSGLYGYLDFHLGDSGSYPRTMVAVHGAQARRFYAPAMRHPEPNGGTMVELPCTKQVLDRALGVISHSPFNLEVARRHHPEGWAAPYRTIPQMVPRPERARAGRAELRARLDIAEDALVIATFGHVAWTKWGDRLLQAFLASDLRDDPRVHLLYVGELARDPFGQTLAEDIAAAGLGQRIRITGFLDEADYADHLHVADIAIQLRTKSRGGTPKGVLDCLAHGVPVIVNDDASYRDYPDDVVVKISADPSVEEIASALTRLAASEPTRAGFAERGLHHVREEHDPARCAGLYAAAIHEFMARAEAARETHAATAAAPLLARTEDAYRATNAFADILEATRPVTFGRRRIFVDVSYIAAQDHETGIPRVVKKIVHHMYTSAAAGVEAVAVRLVDGRLQVASDWLLSKGLLHPAEADAVERNRHVEFARGDCLLMLDSSWARYSEFHAEFGRARAAGARVVTVVYDLLPLRLPPECVVEGGAAWFRAWATDAINSSDALIGISRAVADDLQVFIGETQGLRHTPKLGYWHLGSDIADTPDAVHDTPAVQRLGQRPYLLMVGTIEPRKCHDEVLRAMERLWSEGSELGLVIAGKHGWLRESLMEEMRRHPEQGRRLHLLEHPSDADIQALYDKAAGLMFLSRGEGFGLPLVEAANHGTPVVCSDIPVFREICGPYATYVPGFAPEQVADTVRAWWAACRSGGVPDTRSMPRLTWAQSAEALCKVILEDDWIN